MSDRSGALAYKPRELEILRLMDAGLNSREIAAQLVIGVETVRWYIKQIYSKLDVHSREEALAKAQQLGLLVATQPYASQYLPERHNLPAQLTAFIGREQEIHNIRMLLSTTRLLTLTGPGGSGKTRLALCIAEQLVGDFYDGVYLASLAALTDSRLVAKTIANTLDIAESSSDPLAETLKRALGQRQILLVIDNFEHVLDAAPLVGELLAAAPNLKVLVTSRQVLRLYGEQEYLVPPMSLPDDASLSSLEESEAGRLFMQRAQAVRPDFRLTDENAAAVAAICSHLDGLPLALELAAARCKLLPPQTLLDRLDSRLSALAGGARDAPARQRTLRATIDWSYNLLDESEQKLFARLSVFHGGRTLEAIETVCGVDLPADALDSLASLVDKSLVQQAEGAGGAPRFVILETLHEYAYECLQASGEATEFHRRHASYFVALAERAEPELHLGHQFFWLDRLDEEHDNLRAALAWSLASGDAEMALRLVGALGWFWYFRNHSAEGLRWSERALGLDRDAPPAARAKALLAAGSRLAWSLADHELGASMSQQALALARAVGDSLGEARALGYHTIHAWFAGAIDIQSFSQLIDQAVASFRAIGDRRALALLLTATASAFSHNGDYEQAEALLKEGLALDQQLGNQLGVNLAQVNLGVLAHLQGDNQRAEQFGKQALLLMREQDTGPRGIDTLTIMASIAVAQQQPERAAQILAAIEGIIESRGTSVQEGRIYERALAAVREQLDDATLAALWAKGRAMSLAEVVDYALAEAD